MKLNMRAGITYRNKKQFYELKKDYTSNNATALIKSSSTPKVEDKNIMNPVSELSEKGVRASQNPILTNFENRLSGSNSSQICKPEAKAEKKPPKPKKSRKKSSADVWILVFLPPCDTIW